MTNLSYPLLRVAGACSVLAPLPLLAGDIMQVVGGLGFGWTIALWLSFVLFVPAVIGTAYLTAPGGVKLALAGGASALLGCMAGASVQVLFRVLAVLHEAGAVQAIEVLRQSRKLVLTTQVIGIFFPLGLLLLAANLYRSRIVSPIVPLLLAGGAILFPVGHAVGLAAGLIGGDLLLVAAFGLIGKQLHSAGTYKLKEI